MNVIGYPKWIKTAWLNLLRNLLFSESTLVNFSPNKLVFYHDCTSFVILNTLSQTTTMALRLFLALGCPSGPQNVGDKVTYFAPPPPVYVLADRGIFQISLAPPWASLLRVKKPLQVCQVLLLMLCGKDLAHFQTQGLVIVQSVR